jgi:hypothetical protein
MRALVLLLLALLVAATPTPSHAVTPDLRAPAGYDAAWLALPLRHRQLVRSIHLDRDSSGQSRRATMSIHLPPARSAEAARRTLTHELCHIVAYASPELERAWAAQFWPAGSPLGTPPTAYARTTVREDWAVSCEKARDGDGPDDRDRADFIRAWRVWS